MALTPEAKVKKQIRALLDKHGCYYVAPVSIGMGTHGVPDFLVCVRGRFFGIEAKAGKGKPTALQNANLQRIRDAGGIACVVNENTLSALELELQILAVWGAHV